MSFCSQGVSVPACITGNMTSGSLSRGLCPGGLCPGRSLSRGSLSRGISVKGVSIHGGSLCPWGLCPGGICLGGMVSVLGCPSRGVSLRENPRTETPRLVTCGWYASYWNAFLLFIILSHADQHYSENLFFA